MNASTFSARVTASTLGDVYSAAVTALGTLKGPLHGGANQAAMQQFMEIGSVENVDDWFEHRVAGHGRLMGLGHRVYRVEDPRSVILRELARAVAERSGNTKWYDIAARLEQRALEHPYFQERRIYPNVDYYSAPLLYGLGIPVDLFTLCLPARGSRVGRRTCWNNSSTTASSGRGRSMPGSPTGSG